MVIDGAWKANKNNTKDPRVAAYGWVIFEGNIEKAKGGRVLEAISTTQTEAYALLFGLKECRNDKIKNVLIWTDSKQVVEEIRDFANKVLSSIRNTLLDTLLILEDFESLCIIKVERSKVQKAHILAMQVRKTGTNP